MTKRMGVTEVKRRFADVLGQAMHTKQRIIVERRGRPVVAIVPLDDVGGAARPGQQLASAVGCGEEDGEAFRRLMRDVVSRRRGREALRQAPSNCA